MTTAFDGSAETRPAQLPAPVSPEQEFTGLDTLSLIKQAVAEREEVQPITITVPGGRIRLVCKPDIPERDLRRWQRASLPAHLRKSGGGTPLDSNQMVLSGLVLTHTTEYVQVLDARDNTTWRTVERGGEPLALDDGALLTAFGAMDVQYLLTTIFGRESDVIRAGQKVMEEAGWAGEMSGGDEDDPR